MIVNVTTFAATSTKGDVGSRHQGVLIQQQDRRGLNIGRSWRWTETFQVQIPKPAALRVRQPAIYFELSNEVNHVSSLPPWRRDPPKITDITSS